MISFDEAFAIVAGVARPLASERVALAEAHGRVLAAPVIAAVDAPSADVSAMDGYAVREGDGAALRIVGESFPGAGFGGAVGPGECVRIFTGAPVPEGADRVVVQEIVRREGDRMMIEGSYSSARHIRRRGDDFRAGDALLSAGRLLDARALVAAAGADVDGLDVWRRPRVSLLGTGDELAEPGTAHLRPGSIPESLSLGVAALAREWGGEPVGRRRVKDDLRAIEAAAAEALAVADLVIVTGGASVGEKDYAKGAFDRLGLELLFSKVAIKPGKPVWLGRARGRIVLGLPGNPTSAMVTARLLLAPLIAGLCGRDPEKAARWRTAALAREIGPCGDRETFMRARWNGETVEPLSNQDSGAQRALSEAELLIRRRAGAPAAEAGEAVEIIAF